MKSLSHVDSLQPHDCSLPGSSVHGIFQARILEGGAISFSRGSSQPRNRTQVSFIVSQFSSVTQSCLTLCDPMNHSTPGLPVHHQHRSSLRLRSIESVMPSSHLILCRPLLLLPPILPSNRDFFNELTLRMRWPKYWSFSFSIIPSKEHPGPISFRMDWFGSDQISHSVVSNS